MAADLRSPQVLDKDRQGVGYAAFWPKYLAAHADPKTRGLHYLGTLLAVAALARAGAERDWRWLLAAPVLGYAPAWFGHAVFEGNRPQSFGHPLWSLASDLRMLGLFATGRLGAELRRTEMRHGSCTTDRGGGGERRGARGL